MLDIRNLLRELDNRGVEYLLLSNFSLQNKSFVFDVDLCIPENHKPLFLDAIHEQGFRPRRKQSALPGHFFFISTNPHCNFYLDVQFDLFFTDLNAEHCIRLEQPLSDFIRRRVKSDGVYIPSPEDCLILYAAKCAWQKNKVRITEQQYLLELKHGIKKDIIFQRGLSFESLKALEEVDYEKFISLFRESAPRRVEPLRRINCREKGRRMNVLFLGPDGAGKSTAIEGIKRRMAVRTHVMYLGIGQEGWHSETIRAIKAFCLGAGARFGLDIFFWWIAFPFEIILRRVRARKFGCWCLVLIDRFPGWPLVSGRILRIIYKMILPKPDLIFLLLGDPAKIAARKPNETNIRRTNKEILKCRNVASIFDADVIEFDTTERALEETIDCAVAHLLANGKFQERFLF